MYTSCFRYLLYSRSFTTTIIIVYKTGGGIFWCFGLCFCFDINGIIINAHRQHCSRLSAIMDVYRLKFEAKRHLVRVSHESARTMLLVACTALRRTQYVPGCVYFSIAYALCSWLRVLPESVRAMLLAAYTDLNRTHYVPDCMYCLEAYASCSWLRVPPLSVQSS